MYKEKEQDILFSVSDLKVGFRDHALFENLTLDLKAGELVCFMGPNGVGKSTLIKTLAGLHPPLSHLKGGLKGGEKKISVVLTDKIQVADMSVRELVSFGRYPYLGWNINLSSHDDEIVSRAIGQVRIQHLSEKKLFQLSDGQLQMAMIARALAQETPVLLLDEPTAHLDLNNRVEIMNLLLSLCKKERKAVLVSTHELDLALQTADLLWLAMNKTIKKGIPEDLVLNGALDELFQFKGFDLKTGKVQHSPHRSKHVGLKGEGAELLWTKNALERNGYQVSDRGIHVSISKAGNKFMWRVDEKIFDSISELLKHLDAVDR
ncbi:MAG: ABC transporter ATP-binding protein [Flammeovirgaceae bacterium]|nr:ABC transporter ATP-binding protein [Flammeovirgaceae bacterium]